MIGASDAYGEDEKSMLDFGRKKHERNDYLDERIILTFVLKS